MRTTTPPPPVWKGRPLPPDDAFLERARVWVVDRAGDRADGGWPRAYADLARANGVDVLLSVLGLQREPGGAVVDEDRP